MYVYIYIVSHLISENLRQCSAGLVPPRPDYVIIFSYGLYSRAAVVMLYVYCNILNIMLQLSIWDIDLTKLVSKSQINSLECANVVCETCGGSHSYSQCNMSTNEDVSYIQGSFNQRVGLNSNSYNPQWRSHPGFSWSNPSSQLNPQFNPNTKPQHSPGFPMK